MTILGFVAPLGCVFVPVAGFVVVAPPEPSSAPAQERERRHAAEWCRILGRCGAVAELGDDADRDHCRGGGTEGERLRERAHAFPTRRKR